MHIKLPGNAPRYTSAPEAQQMVRMASLRRTDPHAAQLVEALGIKIEEAQDQGIYNRLWILRQIHAAATIQRQWNAESDWRADPCREGVLWKLWDAELDALKGRLRSLNEEQLAFTQAVLAAVA